MMSNNRYHEYYTVVYRSDSSGETNRVVILDENAKPTPRPPKRRKVYRGFLRDSEESNVIKWPTLDLNSGGKNRWF
tara:strand:+ start:114 stop:341 length:228 start_codon:yes stop_codon:yes gene_type:complete